MYVLEQHDDELKWLGLYKAVWVTCYGIEVSIPNFYSLFELYCPSIGTFFTQLRELGLALHEMREVSKLPMGFLPYDEYFPYNKELEQLMTQDAVLYETYRELMCYFTLVLMPTMSGGPLMD